MNKSNLTKMFELAKKNNAQYIGVKIKLPNLDKAEIILNPISNFDNKLEYYLNTYDENLEMKINKNIKIIDCFILDNFII